jgi:ubiquinone/menaquinone biosynthesis C-methylase UbiE
MEEKKFNPKKLQKLNNPDRLKDIPPDYIQNKLDVETFEILIEIGAGTAFFSQAFLKQLKASTLYACDSSEIMIDWIKENVASKHPNIIAVKNEESSVPLDNGLADLVFMITLHHELENPLLMLKEAHRLLKPDGRIFIVDWKKKEMDDGPPVTIRCSIKDVKAQLVQAGFDNVQTDEDLAKHFLIIGQKSSRVS